MAESSFDAFYRQEYPGVVRLGFVLTGRRDVAEEIAQEAFVAAFRRWARIGGYEAPGQWARRVVINRCVSDARRKLTEARLVMRLGNERVGEPTVSDEDEELWTAVRALPRRQAQVLALRFVEDRSVEDIAAVLGCGEETVRTHLRRGRLALARQFAGTEENASHEEVGDA